MKSIEFDAQFGDNLVHIEITRPMGGGNRFEEDTEETNTYQRIRRSQRKSWKERFWLPIAIVTFIIGFFVDIGKDAFKQKIFKASKDSFKVSPLKSDTSQSRKTKQSLII